MCRILLTVCLLILSITGGCNYVAVTGGKGGPVPIIEELESPGTISFSVEGGKVDPNSPWMVTTGMTYIKHDDSWWSSYVDVSPEFGSFLKIGVEPIPDSGLFINILGGITFLSWSSVWTESEMEVHPLLGGGLTYFIDDGNMCIIASYDNRREVNVGVGFRF